MFYAVAALVAVGVAALRMLTWMAEGWVGVMMCHWAQRLGLEAEVRSQDGRHCFYFRTKRRGKRKRKR
ncbi:MAG TPA: hypothetical protein VGL57_00530 [Solirubrobacteraceae bacterium]|jgi:hypothetical protein